MNPFARTLLLLSALTLVSCKEKAPAPEPISQDPKVQDQRELILQPRSGWVPEKTAGKRQLQLQLIAEKTRIRKGEMFGYRLEIRNIGQKPVVFKEPSPSFIKAGGLCGSQYQFYATPPGGKDARLPCEGPGAAVSETAALDLVLAPGEYLTTKPARAFRPLRTAASFQKTGSYRIRAHYVDGGYRAKSNSIELEVVP